MPWRSISTDMVGNQAGGVAAGRHAEPDDLSNAHADRG